MKSRIATSQGEREYTRLQELWARRNQLSFPSLLMEPLGVLPKNLLPPQVDLKATLSMTGAYIYCFLSLTIHFGLNRPGGSYEQTDGRLF